MNRILVSMLLAAATACGAAEVTQDAASPPQADPGDASPREELDFLALSTRTCTPEVASHEAEPRAHIPWNFEVEYKTNPPSSGLHYATWAEYTAHPLPLDPREYVHNLEHGAVVLLYKCTSATECPSTVTALEALARELGDDPVCTATGSGVRARVLIAPAPTLDVPVAAVAWTWTYKATCFDRARMLDFARNHYGHGPEENCQQGGAGAAMPSRPNAATN